MTRVAIHQTEGNRLEVMVVQVYEEDMPGFVMMGEVDF